MSRLRCPNCWYSFSEGNIVVTGAFSAVCKDCKTEFEVKLKKVK